jgi:CRISPR-associated endonuclease/helicase Cas3
MKVKNINKNKVHKVLKLNECYAKTDKLNNQNIVLGATVFQHSIIVAYVCEEILKQLPKILNDKIPKNISYLASLHDVGKVYPSFQYKIYAACNLYPLGNNFRENDDKEDGYHTSVGYCALRDYDKLASLIANDHHGKAIEKFLDSNADRFGGDGWQSIRMELVLKLNSIFPKVDIDIEEYDYDLILAVIVLSDWIGSSIQNIHGNIPFYILKQEAQKAVNKINFSTPNITNKLTFSDIFSFKQNLLQDKIISEVNTPGTYIIEAPMGVGKTEVALYLSYKMIELGYASGLYFALPTRLTSECMVERVIEFITKIDNKGLVRLVHGGAISPQFLGSADIDWFSSKKKALLAPYGVGTIDQALMSILRVKHNELRKFGLAGKVVILDEVHSYDIYTGTLIVELIQTLRKLGAIIVILSATLNKFQCSKLIGDKAFLEKKISYPSCIFRTNKEIGFFSLPIDSHKEVIIEKSENNFSSCLEAITAAKNGQQVLWIENTVKEAQDIYKLIKANLEEDIEIGLIHSKFISTHRSLNEKKWVGYFGKNNNYKIRRKGRILIGTQVLEQSLDIDCDILFSRVAPIDLTIQRIGRLWRHKINDKFRAINAVCKAVLLKESDCQNKIFPYLKGNSCYVYSKYVLVRTLEVINNDLHKIIIPDDIRNLIEAVYSDREEEGILNSYKQELNQKNNELKNYALYSKGEYGLEKDDTQIKTRYSEQIETQILIINSCTYTNNSLILNFINGQTVELFTNKESSEQMQKKIWLLEQNIVKTTYQKKVLLDSKLLRYLSNYLYIKEDNSSFFCLAIRGSDNKLKSTYGEALGFYYFDNLGLIKEEN